jgi:hypothetical protein
MIQRAQMGEWELVCRKCIAKYKRYKLKIPTRYQGIAYYGCRICSDGKDFFDGPVVAILEKSRTTEQCETDETWQINWFTRKRLFDFDWVEIIEATDEDVERFSVQVGNDTDKDRQGKYREMTCRISSTCNLSDNSMRILKSIFGDIEFFIGKRCVDGD